MAKSILIVDDDKEDLNIMKELLEKKSYKVVLASNGAEALNKITGNRLDLVLIDIIMPPPFWL